MRNPEGENEVLLARAKQILLKIRRSLTAEVGARVGVEVDVISPEASLSLNMN